MTMKYVDNGSITIAVGSKVFPSIGFHGEVAEDFVNFPAFNVVSVDKDYKNNIVTITGYDALEKAKTITCGEIKGSIPTPTAVSTFLASAASAIGLAGCAFSDNINYYNTSYTTGLVGGTHFSDETTLYDAIRQIAERTFTIFYVNHENYLVLKRLKPSATPKLRIFKDNIYFCTNGNAEHLDNIYNVGGLGAIVGTDYPSTDNGRTIYLDANRLWDGQTKSILQSGISALSNTYITPFELDWRGNPALEIGDYIEVKYSNTKSFFSYVLNDTIDFNNGLRQETSWVYDEAKINSDNERLIAEAERRKQNA